MKDIYTTALLELLTPKDGIQTDAAAVLKGFKDTLGKRGHGALYGPVLARVLRQLEAARPGTVVVVASAEARDKQKEAIATALKELGASAEPVVTVDETIIGGFIAEHAHTRTDQSYKHKLVSLYRSITK